MQTKVGSFQTTKTSTVGVVETSCRRTGRSGSRRPPTVAPNPSDPPPSSLPHVTRVVCRRRVDGSDTPKVDTAQLNLAESSATGGPRGLRRSLYTTFWFSGGGGTERRWRTRNVGPTKAPTSGASIKPSVNKNLYVLRFMQLSFRRIT